MSTEHFTVDRTLNDTAGLVGVPFECRLQLADALMSFPLDAPQLEADRFRGIGGVSLRIQNAEYSFHFGFDEHQYVSTVVVSAGGGCTTCRKNS